MYTVSEEFSNQIKANNREFSVGLAFNSTTDLTGTTIQNITVDEVVNSSDVLTIGCACSHKATINLINPPTDIDYKNSFFIARMGLKLGEMPTRYEQIPLGKFYVTDVQTTNDFKNVTITAYDGFCKMTGKYISSLSGRITLQALYDDLIDKLNAEYGIVLKPQYLPQYELDFSNIEDITYQQAIGYVAGCLGRFARFDRLGRLEMVSYTETNVTVSRDEQYMNGFKKLTDMPISITSVSTGTKDNVIVRGDGAGGVAINFENPYITAQMADDVYEALNNLTYTPCQLKWRGNPAVQAGDIIHAIDGKGESHNVLVMSQSIKLGSGLHQIVECKGKSENVSKFTNNFESTSQKIDRIYSTLEEQIIKATEAITGNSGGYVVLNDTNGDDAPDEILVMDAPRKEDAQNVWRWNKRGLGHSSTGYYGPFTTAITAEGAINADFITAGAMSTDLLKIGDERFGNYIRLENGSIVIGEKDSKLTLKLENDRIAFISGGNEIAYFSNNSFEIQNLTNGKIRFQNFGFIPRASGNLTFTKLT